MLKYRTLLNRQQGAAALITTIILLIGVTLVVIFATRVGVLDQKISGNEMRHKEAFANAEAALEQTASFLRVNPSLHDSSTVGWVSCVGSTSIYPCDITGAEMVYGTIAGGDITSILPLAATNATDAFLVKTASNILAIGVGASDDGTGAATAQVAYAKISLITPGEIPPIMGPELNLNGNFTIVADPNNGVGTTGVPISGWTSSNTSGTGSWQTCQLGSFLDGGQVCSEIYTSGDDWGGCGCADNLSNKDIPVSEMLDIYTQATGFPDPFEYIFGPGATVDTIQPRFEDQGKYYPGDCTGLDTLDLTTLSKPWVWVEGDCNVPDIGTATLPVLLVVEGTMRLNATTDAWGLLFSTTEVKSNGAAIVHGSLVAELLSDIANGGYKQVYDESLLEALANDTINTDIGKVKYSWRDF
jgi:type IV pilus assembly PilX-like protein